MQPNKQLTYKYIDGILSVPAKLFYEKWCVMSYKAYNINCHRGKLIRTKQGRGYGNTAYLSYYDLPDIYRDICIAKLGDPKEVKTRNDLELYIQPDPVAVRFFAQHRTPADKALSKTEQRRRVDSCRVLNAIKRVFEDRKITAETFGKRKTKIWQNICDAVNALDTDKYQFKLPGTWTRLKERYDLYVKHGYPIFIHKGEGNTNSTVIKGDIADYLLAKYCLPNKPTVPQVLADYEKERERHHWGTLTEQAINNWLNAPERRRIWVLARHGKEVWANEFRHNMTRKKDNWFPNCYWAIDGTKLDWIHTWEYSQNKLGAQLKIDVLFDVYSEKILGYSLSFTEKHTDHFKAIKMGVNNSGYRPYLFTYDQQGGHRSKRMQDLYDSLIAINGGTHYMHRSKAHNSPAEQLFNRLQQQEIKKFWFSDGQSITVRRDDNKHNPDFINENKHLIKSPEELKKAWEAVVYNWNNAKHPKFEQTRNEVYCHEMPKREEFNVLDIADKMWIKETKAITYRAHGLDLWVANKKYQYEVYDADGNIDLEFRRKNVGNKFIVRYDPEYLDEYVQLWTMNYDAEYVFVGIIEKKRTHEVVPVLMQEGDKEQWAKDYAVRDIELERDLNDYKKLMERTGITPQTLIEDQEFYIKTKQDRPKEERSEIEANENIFSRL